MEQVGEVADLEQHPLHQFGPPALQRFAGGSRPLRPRQGDQKLGVRLRLDPVDLPVDFAERRQLQDEQFEARRRELPGMAVDVGSAGGRALFGIVPRLVERVIERERLERLCRPGGPAVEPCEVGDVVEEIGVGVADGP